MNLAKVLLSEQNSFVKLSLASPNIVYNIKRAIKYYPNIVLTDIPLTVKTYNEYETFVTNLLLQVQPFQNTYIFNDLYISNILANINKYTNLKGIYITTYGVCIKERANLESLFHYYINTEKLKSMIPESTELVVETDSACEYIEGISNTFGSELWLLDFLFQCSKGNATTVVIKTENKNNKYPYVIFRDFSEGRLYPIKYNNKKNINCYGVRDYKNYYIVVINKDVSVDKININVSLDITNPGTLYEFSCNQTILGQEGITYDKTKIIDSANGTYTFEIGTMKAYVLVVPFKSGGAFFENINNSDEKNTIITVNPNPLTDYQDTVPTTMSVRSFKKEYLEDY